MKYVILLWVLLPATTLCQQHAPHQANLPQDDQEILALAREVIKQVRYAALITVDENGQPRSRIVDAFEPDADFVIYVATRPNTRKVAQLRLHEEATLFYFDAEARNYVSIMGRAELIEDIPTKVRLRREADSDRLYPNFPHDYILIRITPHWLEGLLPGYRGDPDNWQPAAVRFSDTQAAKPSPEN